MFIGYSLAHKGYKCLSIIDKIYISASVNFDECNFPIKEISQFVKNYHTKFKNQTQDTILKSNTSLSISPLPKNSATTLKTLQTTDTLDTLKNYQS